LRTLIRVVIYARDAKEGSKVSSLDDLALFHCLNNLVTDIEQNDLISVSYIYDELVCLLVAYEGETNFGKRGETK